MTPTSALVIVCCSAMLPLPFTLFDPAGVGQPLSVAAKVRLDKAEEPGMVLGVLSHARSVSLDGSQVWMKLASMPRPRHPNHVDLAADFRMPLEIELREVRRLGVQN